MRFVYAPTNRALRSNAGPDGYIRMDKDDRRGPFGTITYDRPLTHNEITNWALRTIEMPRVNYNVFGVTEDGKREQILVWKREMPGAFDFVEKMAHEFERADLFVDYAVEPIAS